MEIQFLKLFLTIVREGNLSRAADKLFITQPTLSRQLSDIEKQLDENIKLIGHKNAFANICLIIIDNALDIIKQRNISQGKIIISLREQNNKITLIIEDNGGGVLVEPKGKIFEPYL